MAYVATNAGPSTAAPTHGSRTLTITNGPTREDVGSGEEGSGTGDRHVVGTLRLRARRQAPRVTWTEDVVDNEGMGKKKSKICCIYNKPKRFDESSDESSSDSDGDSDSSCGGHGHGHGHGRDHRHARLPNFRRRRGSSSEDDSSNEGGDEDGVNRSNRRRIASPGQGDLQCQNGDAKVHELSDSESDVNAYERPPSGKGKKGKGKGEDHTL